MIIPALDYTWITLSELGWMLDEWGHSYNNWLSGPSESMPRIIIRGLAAVFKGDARVTDADVLRGLAAVRYDDERFTDYLGGPPAENALAEALEPGGTLFFGYADG